jgi:hypothetical protein
LSHTGLFKVSVEYACDQEIENRLTAFSIGTRRIMIREIVDRWPAAGYSYIKLLGDDGAQYILRHDEISHCWEMTLFQAP